MPGLCFSQIANDEENARFEAYNVSTAVGAFASLLALYIAHFSFWMIVQWYIGCVILMFLLTLHSTHNIKLAVIEACDNL